LAWIYLIIAGIFEVVWALGMKQTEGFTRFWPSVYTLGFMGVSFYLLALAMRELPVGTAYAVWTGIGAVGAVIFGMLWLGEARDAPRLICVALILCGVIGLKVFSKPDAPATAPEPVVETSATTSTATAGTAATRAPAAES